MATKRPEEMTKGDRIIIDIATVDGRNVKAYGGKPITLLEDPVEDPVRSIMGTDYSVLVKDRGKTYRQWLIRNHGYPIV